MHTTTCVWVFSLKARAVDIAEKVFQFTFLHACVEEPVNETFVLLVLVFGATPPVPSTYAQLIDSYRRLWILDSKEQSHTGI